MLSRQDFTTTIGELDGRTVEAFRVMIARWSDGVEDAQWMLLKVKGGHWHRFFLDVGVLFWSEEKAVAAEHLDTHSPDPKRTYELRDVDEAVGKVLGAVKMEQVAADGQLTLGFHDGKKLVFRNVDTGTDDELTRFSWA